VKTTVFATMPLDPDLHIHLGNVYFRDLNFNPKLYNAPDLSSPFSSSLAAKAVYFGSQVDPES
jgi:hypothetical protein